MPTALKVFIGIIVVVTLTIYATNSFFLYLEEWFQVNDFFGIAGAFVYLVALVLILIEIIVLIIVRNRPSFRRIVLYWSLPFALVSLPAFFRFSVEWVQMDRAYSAKSVSGCARAKDFNSWSSCVGRLIITESDRSTCVSQATWEVPAMYQPSYGASSTVICDQAFAAAANRLDHCRYDLQNCFLRIINEVERKNPNLLLPLFQQCGEFTDSATRRQCIHLIYSGYYPLVSTHPSRQALCLEAKKYEPAVNVIECAAATDYTVR